MFTKAIKVPKTLLRLRTILKFEGFDLRYVGGCVRDWHLGIEPKDFDLCTDAVPEKLMELARKIDLNVYPTGIDHGTVTIMGEEGEPYEITTLRLDVATDGRHAEVAFTDSWEEDAKRRDLTMNALYMSLDMVPVLYDYVGGIKDLDERRVRFVGDANARVQEDYLRILRFFRFAARFGGEFDDDGLRACRVHAKGLRFISKERISSEMIKILSYDAKVVPDMVRIMHGNGILDEIGVQGSIHYGHFRDVCMDSTDYRTRLVGLCEESGQDPREITSAWKWSNADKALVDYLWTNSHDGSAPYTYDVVMKGKPKEWVAERMKLEGATEYLDEFAEFEAPVFPVTGHDMVAMGLRGPAIGKMLATAKDVWYWRGMTATKDEIMGWIKNA